MEDQFEELFTLCHEDSLQAGLNQQPDLRRRVSQGRTVVVLAFRADFCRSLRPLSPRWLKLYPTTRSRRTNERRRTRLSIERPAAIGGAEFEPGLVGRTVARCASTTGSLLLVQHAFA